jgi:hypothetical protein
MARVQEQERGAGTGGRGRVSHHRKGENKSNRASSETVFDAYLSTCSRFRARTARGRGLLISSNSVNYILAADQKKPISTSRLVIICTKTTRASSE